MKAKHSIKPVFLFCLAGMILIIFPNCSKNSTPTATTVITVPVKNITPTTATSGGTVISAASGILERGIFWGTQSPPEYYEENKISIPYWDKSDNTFSCIMTHLIPNTKYYVQAYLDCWEGGANGDVIAFTTAEEPPIPPCPGLPTISYQGKIYNTVQIGSQCWMMENMNIGSRIDSYRNQTNNGMIEKYCLDDKEDNCDKYGGLYQWNEMMMYASGIGLSDICPSGWHIPTDEEFTILVDFLGGDTIAGGKMKSTSPLWNYYFNTGNGTNSSGFTALPGGHRENIGFQGWPDPYFWSSSQDGASTALARIIYGSGDYIMKSSNEKTFGCSARCLKN